MSQAGIRVTYGALPQSIMDGEPSALMEAKRAAVNAALPYLQRRLALATPSGATGKARQLVAMELSVQPSSVVGFVGYAEPASGYMGFVEDGTRPHWPPIAAMQLYAARKFGYLVGSPEARRAGYLIARSISRKGTKAQHVVENVANASR